MGLKDKRNFQRYLGRMNRVEYLLAKMGWFKITGDKEFKKTYEAGPGYDNIHGYWMQVLEQLETEKEDFEILKKDPATFTREQARMSTYFRLTWMKNDLKKKGK